MDLRQVIVALCDDGVIRFIDIHTCRLLQALGKCLTYGTACHLGAQEVLHEHTHEHTNDVNGVVRLWMTIVSCMWLLSPSSILD